MRRTEVKRDIHTGNVHVLAFGTDWNVCGILFFLNYEKNYLTRDNIKENVPAANLHTGRWKTSIEKITRQGYDKHMTTSKKNRFLSIIKMPGLWEYKVRNNP